MKRPKLPSLLSRLAGHLAMGVALGLTFGLLLVVENVGHIDEMITSSTTPDGSLLAFVGAFAFAIGIGATLTGFMFETNRP